MNVIKFLWNVVYIEPKNILEEMARISSRIVVTTAVVLLRKDIQCDVPMTTIFSHGGIGIVISRNVKLGEHIIIGQNVTIGKRHNDKVPIIEDWVVINPHALLIGDIRIGHHSIIGGGAVVIHNIPPYSVVVGNPAHVVHRIHSAIEYDSYRNKRK
jgi:serine O-acetyltransferase